MEFNFQILKLDLRFQIKSNGFSRDRSFGHQSNKTTWMIISKRIQHIPACFYIPITCSNWHFNFEMHEIWETFTNKLKKYFVSKFVLTCHCSSDSQKFQKIIGLHHRIFKSLSQSLHRIIFPHSKSEQFSEQNTSVHTYV